MLLKILIPKSLSDLKTILENNSEILVFGAQTSTVIPFSRPEVLATLGLSTLVDLSCMPKEILLSDDRGQVQVVGSVSWKELREYLEDKGLDVGCWPTDETALVLSGLATSATGERCFSYGTLRDHCVTITYLNEDNVEQTLNDSLLDDKILGAYQKNFDLKFASFKNGPYPRLKKQTDLMIGMEGQLGIILSATLRIFPRVKTNFVLIPVESFTLKTQLVDLIRHIRKDKRIVASLEFFDKNAVKFSGVETLLDRDYVAVEVHEESLEDFIESLSMNLPTLAMNHSVSLNKKQFYDFRVSIPRNVNEFLSRNKILKLGTDAQVSLDNFENLLDIYAQWSEMGIKFVLFGHLGDCHLHFNFLPKESEVEKCHKLLEKFYHDLAKMDASPFAEHGIGLIKKKFMKKFYNDDVVKVFKYLKGKYNSKNKFYTKGFLENE